MAGENGISVNTTVLRQILGGFLIGIAFLVPGISGGALAATLGFFEPAIAALSDMRKSPGASIRYLLPLLIGGAAGAFLAAVLLVRLLDTAETQAISFFMGMLAGTLPKLWRDGYTGKPALREWLLMLAGLLVTVGLFVLESTMQAGAAQAITLPIALASGAIFGAGAVLPGISGSFFMIYLGWYKPMMEAIVRFDIPVILMTALGFLLVLFLLVRVANYLFQRHRRPTYAVIIGFVAGSLALVLPSDFFGSLWWANTLLFFGGIAAGIAVGHLDKKDTRS